MENAWLLLETDEGGSRGADTGIVGGLDGFRAGGTDWGTSRVAGCTLMLNKLSISSISDCDDVFRFILSIPDIVTCNTPHLLHQRKQETAIQMLEITPSTPQTSNGFGNRVRKLLDEIGRAHV